VLHDPVGGSIIIAIVLLSVMVNFYVEFQAGHAVEDIRRQVATTAAVLRDGHELELPVAELVPGDVVKLNAGDLAPADARLLDAKDLHVRESALTGESLPVDKGAADLPAGQHGIADASNSVFLGTAVQTGIGTAVIVRTGKDTAFGEIAQRLAMRPPETEFGRGIRHFGLMITRVIMLLVLFVPVNIVLHRPFLESSVMNGVDVAKDAAKIIPLEKDLAVMNEGVTEGRRCFANIMTYIVMRTSSNFGNMFSMAAASLFLPFLPMLPTQILLNNFLYDTSQVAVPGDNVDPAMLHRPKRWQIGFIRQFMTIIGPISSLYDSLTLGVLLWMFHASTNAPLFRAGWFVESLATQTLVVFVIRTAGSPFKSCPSGRLLIGVVAVSLAGALLGFAPLPLSLLGAISLLALTYLNSASRQDLVLSPACAALTRLPANIAHRSSSTLRQ
jgi:magnesium-transporting ATPase (P-type)